MFPFTLCNFWAYFGNLTPVSFTPIFLALVPLDRIWCAHDRQLFDFKTQNGITTRTRCRNFELLEKSSLVQVACRIVMYYRGQEINSIFFNLVFCHQFFHSDVYHQFFNSVRKVSLACFITEHLVNKNLDSKNCILLRRTIWLIMLCM
jgi:hypothetical protein